MFTVARPPPVENPYRSSGSVPGIGLQDIHTGHLFLLEGRTLLRDTSELIFEIVAS